MNKENLLRMADYIETIPQEQFGMREYRAFNEDLPGNEMEQILSAHKCGTVGCVIGHCVVLDNPKKIPMTVQHTKYGTVSAWDYAAWSERFTGLEDPDEYPDEELNMWCWCFSPSWEDVDNTPTGAAKRIRLLVNSGLPANWHYQMAGIDPLSY